MYICLQPKKSTVSLVSIKCQATISLLRTLLMATMCIPLKSLPCPKRVSGSVSECQGSNQMQPEVNGDPLTINEEGTQNPTYYNNISNGSDKAWKVSYTAGEYEYLTVNVDITEGATRRVWIEGKKTSAGESGEPATDVEPGYYLVGNFFSQYNKGGEYNPGGDGATIDYKKHVYFKFEQQRDKSYSFSIPACLTHMHRFLLLTSMTKRWFTDRARYSTCMVQRIIPAHGRQQTKLWELFVEQQGQRHLSVLREWQRATTTGIS